jgi:hypothetical protein
VEPSPQPAFEPPVAEPPAPDAAAPFVAAADPSAPAGPGGVLERPEVLVGAALAGGILIAIILRRLGS